jgi:hypothetical protein
VAKHAGGLGVTDFRSTENRPSVDGCAAPGGPR